MKTRSRVNISERDEDLLYFLWRHRVATFATLHHLFFPKTGKETVYNRLRRLRTFKYLRTDYTERGGKAVWCLGERGFRVLEALRLSDLKNTGYRSQSPYHDVLVTAAILGSWLDLPPEDIVIITEQELVSQKIDCIPAKLLERFSHRPDGLWIKYESRETCAVALEVELNAKSEARYEEICSFYGGLHFIENVFWIIPDKNLARKIQSIAATGAMPRVGQHLFVLLEDFKKNLWKAQILNPTMNGISMANFLNKFTNKPCRSLIESPIESSIEQRSLLNRDSITSPLLDFSLSIERLKTYNQKTKASFS